MTFETSTSPICICTFCTTRIVVFHQEKITSQNTLTYSMRRTTTPTGYRIATSIKNIYGTESVALSHEDFREITFFPTPIHNKRTSHANLRPHIQPQNARDYGAPEARIKVFGQALLG